MFLLKFSNFIFKLYSVHCLASEQWDRPISGLTCSPLICPALILHPTVIQNCDNLEGTEDLVGTACELQCVDENAVAQLNLEKSVKCVADPTNARQAVWSSPVENLLVCKLLGKYSKYLRKLNFLDELLWDLLKRTKRAKPTHFFLKSKKVSLSRVTCPVNKVNILRIKLRVIKM
jgi:hypothetical protein